MYKARNGPGYRERCPLLGRVRAELVRALFAHSRYADAAVSDEASHFRLNDSSLNLVPVERVRLSSTSLTSHEMLSTCIFAGWRC